MTSIGPKGCPRSRSIYTRVDVHAEWLTGGAGSAAEPEASEPEPALAEQAAAEPQSVDAGHGGGSELSDARGTADTGAPGTPASEPPALTDTAAAPFPGGGGGSSCRASGPEGPVGWAALLLLLGLAGLATRRI